MKNLVINGTQNFMNKEIPVVSGGFGENKKCISDKTIAEIHNMRTADVRRRVFDNLNRFKENIDFIDLKRSVHQTHTLNLEELGYTKSSITQAEHIYLLSERGYAKLIKIMDTDLAWEIHDKLIDEYFELRDEKQKPVCIEDVLIQSLQEMKAFREEQTRQAEQITQVEERVNNIKEVVALNPTQWRKDTSNLINRIARNLGGFEHIRVIRDESYKLLEQRMGVLLNVRLTNKKKTMALNGACKSKLDRLNQLDVIADDKKLIEGYISIVKELSIKYGVA